MNVSRVVLAWIFLIGITPTFAANFTENDQELSLSGQLVAGDAAKFADFVNARSKTWTDWSPTVSLSSPGGSLAEGLALGLYFRDRRIATRVRKGQECYSACAVAFLGGTQAYATGSGIGRYLEVGAVLGFHGFSQRNNKVTLVNEAFDLARVTNALIIQYASGLRGIDLQLLSQLIGVDPKSIRVVRTPREIEGLSIKLEGKVPPRPRTWPLNVCARYVDELRPINDGPIDGRISASSRVVLISDKAHLAADFLTKYMDEKYQRIYANLPPEEIIRLAVGTEPQFPVYRIETVRGAGFYYDYCYAMDSGNGHIALLLPGEGFGGYKSQKFFGRLSGFDADVPLWR